MEVSIQINILGSGEKTFLQIHWEMLANLGAGTLIYFTNIILTPFLHFWTLKMTYKTKKFKILEPRYNHHFKIQVSGSLEVTPRLQTAGSILKITCWILIKEVWEVTLIMISAYLWSIWEPEMQRAMWTESANLYQNIN